jgi:2-polyprenyl-3-methyl-5-hydroxy-6-metoxy-1,4-benzoquinol methylase
LKSLLSRNSDKEILDDLSCTGEAVCQNLKELDIINYLLGGNAVSTNALKKTLQDTSQKQWHIADIGCGSGQLMIEMNTVLCKRKLTGLFTGFDANPFIVAYANTHCKDEPNISIQCLNVISDFFSEDYDIVHASLFLHHFTEEELVLLLQKISAHTRKAIIINDLHRHPLAYYSIKLLTRLFSKSHMVRNDAALSVAKGFTKKEWNTILKNAGFKRWDIRWVWAFRHQLILYPIDKN